MITTLVLLAATAGTPALDYTAAKALADRDEAAMSKLAAGMLQRSQSTVLERAADKCKTDEKPAPFTVVLELDANGKATNHWRSAETGLAKCMEEKLSTQMFYVPQKAPFYISFEVSFTP
jgi:hypothetical protein